MLHRFDRERAAQAAAAEIVPKAQAKRHAATLAAIRRLYEERNSNGMKNLLFSAIFNGYTHLPSDQDLHDLAVYQFPPRASLKAQVCDFYPGHAELKEVALGDIEARMLYFFLFFTFLLNCFSMSIRYRHPRYIYSFQIDERKKNADFLKSGRISLKGFKFGGCKRNLIIPVSIMITP